MMNSNAGSLSDVSTRRSPYPPPPLTSAMCTSQGLEVVLAWKINDVTEEPLSAESLLEHL